MEIILALYFSLLIGVGFLASKKIHDISDYYVGGKKLNYWIAALSARSTGESGWLLLGVTGMGAVMGVSAFWIVIGEVLGFLSWHFMAEKFKHLLINIIQLQFQIFYTVISIQKQYDKNDWCNSIISFVVIYVSAQIDITGKTFESFQAIITTMVY